jgi:hypothetical protein
MFSAPVADEGYHSRAVVVDEECPVADPDRRARAQERIPLARRSADRGAMYNDRNACRRGSGK